MPDDLTRYLAHRLFDLYPLPSPPAAADLLEACDGQGWPVLDEPSLGERAYCLRNPELGIARGPDAPLRKLPHEMYHAWSFDNAIHGITYHSDWWQVDDPEDAARRFAELVLADRRPFVPSDALRGFRLREPECPLPPWRPPAPVPPKEQWRPVELLALGLTRFSRRIRVLRCRERGALAEWQALRVVYVWPRPHRAGAARAEAALRREREAEFYRWYRQHFGWAPEEV